MKKIDIADRKSYLGGSEIASALGMSRYKTQLQLWSEKVGLIEPEDISKKFPVRYGQKAEAIVASMFEEDTGLKLRRVNEAYIHPKHDFLVAHIDRKVEGKDEIVEIKTTDSWRLKEFDGDNVPTEFVLQLMFYLALTGAKVGYIACMFGNQALRIKRLEKDKTIEDSIIKKAVKFWTEYVMTNTMPMHIVAQDDDVLFRLFPQDYNTEAVELGDEANRLVESLQALKSDQKNMQNNIDTAENLLKAMLKEHEAGKTDRYMITWKRQETNRLDTASRKAERPEIADKYTKKIASRVLRYKQIKGSQED